MRTVYKMKAQGATQKAEHILVAEQVLGFKLPLGVIVHHADGNSLNNSKNNLVICQDRTYHNLLHARMRAKEACGNPNWRKCPYCKEYDAPENLVNQAKYDKTRPGRITLVHADCKKSYLRKYFQTKHLECVS